MRMANDGFNEISKLNLMVEWPLPEPRGVGRWWEGGTTHYCGSRVLSSQELPFFNLTLNREVGWKCPVLHSL